MYALERPFLVKYRLPLRCNNIRFWPYCFNIPILKSGDGKKCTFFQKYWGQKVEVSIRKWKVLKGQGKLSYLTSVLSEESREKIEPLYTLPWKYATNLVLPACYFLFLRRKRQQTRRHAFHHAFIFTIAREEELVMCSLRNISWQHHEDTRVWWGRVLWPKKTTLLFFYHIKCL